MTCREDTNTSLFFSLMGSRNEPLDDPLDASEIRPAIGNLLEKILSMVEMKEITSMKRLDDVADDLITNPLGHGENVSNENKNEVNDGNDHTYDKPVGDDDDDDYFFLDIENEQEIPLADVNCHPAFMTAATTDNNQLTSSFEKSAYSNETDMCARPEKVAIRNCHSMSELKSSLPKKTALKNNEGIHSLTGNNTEQVHKMGLRRSISQSILKSSSLYSSSSEGNLQRQRTASFSTLEIREYAITLGDNPGGVQGPPISLDWEYDGEQTQVIPLETYEDTRPPRRKRSEMYMAENLRRWRLLRENGCSLNDIDKATKAAETVRKQRKKSISTKPAISILKKKIGRIIGYSSE